MIRINSSNQTFIIIRPKIKQFIASYIPPDDIDIVIKSLVSDYFSEFSGFNIFNEMLTHDYKKHALFILPHSIYTTVGKATSDIFIAGVFTFNEEQFTPPNKTAEANISFIIGMPSEIIKLIKALERRDLKVSYLMKPTAKYTNKYDIDFSHFITINNK